MKYPDKGVTFYLQKKARKNYQIRMIVFEDSCCCKTTTGIAVGSAKSEVLKEMGEPKNNDIPTLLFYDDINILFKEDPTGIYNVSQISIYRLPEK